MFSVRTHHSKTLLNKTMSEPLLLLGFRTTFTTQAVKKQTKMLKRGVKFHILLIPLYKTGIQGERNDPEKVLFSIRNERICY